MHQPTHPVEADTPLPLTGNPVRSLLSRLRDALKPGDGPAVAGAALAAVVVLWASWPAVLDMVSRWSHDPRYSHGFLVPAFSVALLWVRRDMLEGLRPSSWGLALVAAGTALKLVGLYVWIEWLDKASLLPSLAGLFVLLGGWHCLRWAWPSVAFLVFMIPLPYRVEYQLGQPLQRVATAASTYALQTLGLPAVADGFVIMIDDARIGVVEACNGLGMLFMFFAFTTAATFVIDRRPLDKALIFLSAVPISLAANVARITLTGFLHATAGGNAADAFYHDLAGWLMMPLALAALWAEMALLSRLFVEAGPDHHEPVDLFGFGVALPRATPGSPGGGPHPLR